MRRLLGTVLFALSLVAWGNIQSQQPQQTPQIKAEQQPKSLAKNQEHSNQSGPPLAAPQKEDPQSNTDQSEQEGTEFWPSLRGYHIKITDSLLVFFTLVLAIFTGLLYRSTEKLWTATEKSIDLARQEFISAHHPKLIVRRVSLHQNHRGNRITGIEHASAGVEYEVTGVEYIVANVGSTRATIIESNATIYVNELYPGIVNPGLGAMPPYDDDSQSIGVVAFEAGESGPFVEHSEVITADLLYDTRAESPVTPKRLYFLGYILYKDEIGTVRRTAFCRIYDHGSTRFFAIDDAEYEYS